MTKTRIPPITDKDLEFLSQLIKPLIKKEDCIYILGNKYNTVQMRSESYTWEEKKILTKTENLIEICRIRTLHTFGYYGLFKPSIAEV